MQRGTFIVIHLLFKLGHALNLVFDRRVSSDALLALELSEELVNVAGAALEDFLGALEDLHLGLELLERLLALLVLRVFLLQIRRVLTEVVALEILGALGRLICLLALCKGLLESNLLRLQALDLLLLLLLLLLDALGLRAVDR